MKPLNSFLGEALLQIALARAERVRGVTRPIPDEPTSVLHGNVDGTSTPLGPSASLSAFSHVDTRSNDLRNCSALLPSLRNTGDADRTRTCIDGIDNPAPNLSATAPIERRDFLAPLDVKKARPEQTEAAPRGEDVFVDSLTGLPVSLDDLMAAL